MSWNPQPDGLNELLQLLKDSISGNNQVQAAVQERLDSFNKIPEYNNYLTYILTQMPQEETSRRAIAGLVLKNNIRLHYSQIPTNVIDYIKQQSILAIGDPDPAIRGTVGTIITTIVREEHGCQKWPDLLSKLVANLDLADYNVIEGSFGALQKICEDEARQLQKETDASGVPFLNFMIPKFINFFNSNHPKLRVLAISCVNQFILIRSPSLNIHIDAYLAALFQRATDENPEVRKQVCQALVLLLESNPDKILPFIDNVINYMLFSTQDDDEIVSLEACEFWLTFAEQDELRDHLRRFLPQIVPVLLKGMIYSEVELITMGVEDDADIPDNEQDIKPRHHKAKTHEFEKDTINNGETQASNQENEDTDDDDDDDDDDDFDDDDFAAEWNLRKCSAASLDVLSNHLGNDILEVFLPHLKEYLFNPDWKHKEAGIIALGAVAEGCITGIGPHLPDLIPFLIQNLSHPKHPVRSISCWTIGRYSRWCVYHPDKKSFFEPVIDGLLRMILDNNKRVQEAGCSAFATFEEEAQTELIPYLDPILHTLVCAFEKYQHKNLLILYDAVGTLADCVSTALNHPKYIEAILPPLIRQWHSLQDDDRDIFPLLECLSSVTAALGTGFMPYAPPVFDRCVNLIHKSLIEYQLFQQNPQLEEPDKDFMIVALDLLSGLTQGLGKQIQQLITNSQTPLLQLLIACLNEISPEVRQSAYALLGDMSIQCFEILRPHLNQIIPGLIHQIDPNFVHPNVCNNAVWAAGEISIQLGQSMQPYVQPILERIIPLQVNPATPITLLENVSITLGRLGLVSPVQVAPHLESFAERWCRTLRFARENSEKETSFRGMCNIVQANPNGMAKCFVFFCESIASWQNPSPALHESFTQILIGFKQMMGPNWSSYFSAFPLSIRQRLSQRYGV